jgi:meso-butanediol dehydrogenase/(S,S)-butanediol dehydrogenase/diacetyl reductase
MTSPLPLSGMTAAITGAGQGIGRAIALRLATDGADIAISDINEAGAQKVAEEVRALGRRALALRTDVTSRDDCARMVEAITAEFGRLDLMVCNAGVVQAKPFMDITAEDWDPLLQVNVKGVFLTIQAAARQMREQPKMGDGRPRGKIITLASIAGRYGAGPMAPVIPHYRASKAAVISITQSAAFTLAPDITVNAMCPGLVEGDMWKLIDKQWSAIENWEEGEAWKRRTGAVPLGRPQQASDVAGLAAFLAGKDADYMTGQSINIEGGLTMS